MPAQSLYKLLNSCVVLITIPAKKAKGTGFFVAPGKILTCAHVVEPAQANNLSIEVSWQGQPLTAQIQQFRDIAATDLALLEVNLTNHPCVLLYGGAEPRNHLYSFGFPDIEQQGASTTFESEGWAGSQLQMLRLKQGQARPGMSGSPLLNLEIGSVCGIVQETRDRNSDLGGKALSTQVILHEFPGLEEQQKQYHQQHRTWSDSLTPQQRQHLSLSWLTTSSTGAIEVFISYAKEDTDLLKQLVKHLKPMKREGLITDWFDHDIEAGEDTQAEAKNHLYTARIILLLVSSNYLASDDLYDGQMMEALKRHQANHVRVIPIMLQYADGWQKTEFSKLLSLPRDGKPVTKWSDRDEALYNIAREIRRVVEQLPTNP